MEPDRTPDPYAPPTAVVGDRLADGQGRGPVYLARPSQRFGAFLVDGLLLPALVAGPGALVGGLLGVVLAPDDPLLGAVLVYALPAVLLLLWTAYQASLLQRGGWTFGKRAVGIRIIRSDGRRAGLVRTFWVRWVGFGLLTSLLSLVTLGVGGPLLFLIDSLLVFGRGRRTLHDRLADTIVVAV